MLVFFLMVFFLICGIAVAATATILILAFRRRRHPPSGFPVNLADPAQQPPKTFHAQPFLFSKTQDAFYRVLQPALAGQYIIMAKVRLADIVTVHADSNSARVSACNLITAQHVDFILLHPTNLSLQLVIQLDDQSLAPHDPRHRNALVDSILTQAAIPILHIPTSHTYDPQSLLQQITQFRPPAATPNPAITT